MSRPHNPVLSSGTTYQELRTGKLFIAAGRRNPQSPYLIYSSYNTPSILISRYRTSNPDELYVGGLRRGGSIEELCKAYNVVIQGSVPGI